MKIATLLPVRSQKALQRILWTGHSLKVAKSPESLVALVRGGGCELIVIDPTGIRDKEFEEILTAIVHAGVAVALWGHRGFETFDRVLQISVHLPTTVLLRDENDDEDGLRAMVHAGVSATAMILHRLARHVLLLPQDSIVRRTAMFCGTPIPASLDAYTTRAGRSSRTVQRRFLEAGLGKPGRFLKIVRLARAWEQLKTTNASLRDVAERCRFASEQAMSQQFSLCVGFPPRRAVRHLTQVEFVAFLLRAITSRNS